MAPAALKACSGPEAALRLISATTNPPSPDIHHRHSRWNGCTAIAEPHSVVLGLQNA